MQIKHIDEATKKWTFAPKINENSKRLLTEKNNEEGSKSIIERSVIYIEKRANRVKEINEQVENKFNQEYNFVPKTTKYKEMPSFFERVEAKEPISIIP